MKMGSIKWKEGSWNRSTEANSWRVSCWTISLDRTPIWPLTFYRYISTLTVKFAPWFYRQALQTYHRLMKTGRTRWKRLTTVFISKTNMAVKVVIIRKRGKRQENMRDDRVASCQTPLLPLIVHECIEHSAIVFCPTANYERLRSCSDFSEHLITARTEERERTVSAVDSSYCTPPPRRATVCLQALEQLEWMFLYACIRLALVTVTARLPSLGIVLEDWTEENIW